MTAVTLGTPTFVRFSDAHATPTEKEWADLTGAPGLGRLVYFIESRESGLIKIGISNDPWRRLEQMGDPSQLKILAVESGGAAREWDLHQRFAEANLMESDDRDDYPESRVHGAEWFFPAQPILDYLGPEPQ
ncbi:MAG: GIY-YIG nuclease family protein [Actinobacteria bacterium]|nr:GIY-YIG nuclease family protein [Actinomycetota bacterium]